MPFIPDLVHSFTPLDIDPPDLNSLFFIFIFIFFVPRQGISRRLIGFDCVRWWRRTSATGKYLMEKMGNAQATLQKLEKESGELRKYYYNNNTDDIASISYVRPPQRRLEHGRGRTSPVAQSDASLCGCLSSYSTSIFVILVPRSGRRWQAHGSLSTQTRPPSQPIPPHPYSLFKVAPRSMGTPKLYAT